MKNNNIPDINEIRKFLNFIFISKKDIPNNVQEKKLFYIKKVEEKILRMEQLCFLLVKLEKVNLKKEKIAMIGPGTISILKDYNIETFADIYVNKYSLKNIPSINNAKESLLINATYEKINYIYKSNEYPLSVCSIYLIDFVKYLLEFGSEAFAVLDKIDEIRSYSRKKQSFFEKIFNSLKEPSPLEYIPEFINTNIKETLEMKNNSERCNQKEYLLVFQIFINIYHFLIPYILGIKNSYEIFILNKNKEDILDKNTNIGLPFFNNILREQNISLPDDDFSNYCVLRAFFMSIKFDNERHLFFDFYKSYLKDNNYLNTETKSTEKSTLLISLRQG